MNRHSHMLEPGRQRLMATWLAVTLTLGGALIAAQRDRGPLDDRDLALQRPGFLDAHHRPTRAPQVAPDVPQPGRRAVVFFVRAKQVDALMRALRDGLGGQPRIAIVLQGMAARPRVADPPLVLDGSARLAREFAMRRPRDGGAPVGYAIVDRSGRVRYRTLDPGLTHRLREVETMLKATP